MIFELFWFFLPAGFANMTPKLVSKINFLNKSISNKLFGSHKTWRGLIFGVLAAMVIIYLQRLIGINSIIDYDSVNVFLLGFLLGFGAILGDVVKSFFKRRVGIKPGEPWVPLDQVDWIIGALLLTIFYVPLSVLEMLIILIMFGILHPIINYISYLLKIQKNKF